MTNAFLFEMDLFGNNNVGSTGNTNYRNISLKNCLSSSCTYIEDKMSRNVNFNFVVRLLFKNLI